MCKKLRPIKWAIIISFWVSFKILNPKIHNIVRVQNISRRWYNIGKNSDLSFLIFDSLIILSKLYNKRILYIMIIISNSLKTRIPTVNCATLHHYLQHSPLENIWNVNNLMKINILIYSKKYKYIYKKCKISKIFIFRIR